MYGSKKGPGCCCHGYSAVCTILMTQSLFTSAVQQATKTYDFWVRSWNVWGRSFNLSRLPHRIEPCIHMSTYFRAGFLEVLNNIIS